MTSFKIGIGQVFGNDIADGTVGSADLGTDSVGFDEIQGGAIAGVQFQNGAATSAKLADDAITSRIYQRTAVSADNGSALPKELTASCDAGDAAADSSPMRTGRPGSAA